MKRLKICTSLKVNYVVSWIVKLGYERPQSRGINIRSHIDTVLVIFQIIINLNN
jgi:hypothetical protein